MALETKPVQVCTKCVMDTISNTEITFDDIGICNYCRYYENVLRKQLYEHPDRLAFHRLIERVKSGRRRKYDCVLGVSGGSDSSYSAYLLHEAGLNVLMVHCDNGWDDGSGVHNLRQLSQKLKFDLYNYTITWEEFRDIQLSVLRSSVMDIEIVSDHVNIATLFHAARKHGVRWIFTGENFKTEGTMPGCWVHNKNDLYHIRSIHKKFGSIPLKTFPKLGFIRKKYFEKILGIKIIPLLNYVEYNKQGAIDLLEQKLEWKHPGGKHFESLFTRLYQTYILPVKFGVDKRKAHLSTLIQSGQISRKDALDELSKPIISSDALRADRTAVLAQLSILEADFEQMMAAHPRSHKDYPYYFYGYKWLRSKWDLLFV
ncbi:MAG: biosynthesis protein WbpG [Bacteroidetes bacterium]|nr:biosynthesis protein WbpG [Bacteroidota bacterium]